MCRYVYGLILSFVCIQILKEDDTLWPQPDRVGRQVSFIGPLSVCIIIMMVIEITIIISNNKYWYIPHK